MFYLSIVQSIAAQECRVLAITGHVFEHSNGEILRVQENDNIFDKQIEIKENSCVWWEYNSKIFKRKTVGIFQVDTLDVKTIDKVDESDNILTYIWNVLTDENNNTPDLNGMGLGLPASVSRGDGENEMFLNGKELFLLAESDFILAWNNFKDSSSGYNLSFFDSKNNEVVLDTTIYDTIMLVNYSTIEKCEWCEVSIAEENFISSYLLMDTLSDDLNTALRNHQRLIDISPEYNYLKALWLQKMNYTHNMLAYIYKAKQNYPDNEEIISNWNVLLGNNRK